MEKRNIVETDRTPGLDKKADAHLDVIDRAIDMFEITTIKASDLDTYSAKVDNDNTEL